MNEIEQIKQYITYDSKTGEFFRKVSGLIKTSVDSKGYFRIFVCKKRYKASRLAWMLFYGKKPLKFLDHINGVRTDNRIENLREVTNSENCQNQIRPKRTNKSGFLGVVKHTKGWQANITKQGTRYFLGTFPTPQEAYIAYLKVKKQLHVKTILVV